MKCQDNACSGGKCRSCRMQRYETARMLASGHWYICQDAGGFVARESGGSLLVSIRETSEEVYAALVDRDFAPERTESRVCTLPCRYG